MPQKRMGPGSHGYLFIKFFSEFPVKDAKTRSPTEIVFSSFYRMLSDLPGLWLTIPTVGSCHHKLYRSKC
jgi:hypothetical protein